MKKKALRRLFLLFIRLLGTRRAYLAAQQTKKPISARPRILLVRPDHLGDLVVTTPVLHGLREALPDASITMMVGPWSRDVVAHHPDIDQLLTCPVPGVRGTERQALKPFLLMKTAKQLRQEHFDLAVSLLGKSWWVAALLYLAAIPRRVGYANKLSKPFLTHSLPLSGNEHATVSCLRLTSTGLQTLGYPPLKEPYTPACYPLHFVPTVQEREWMRQRLLLEGIEEGTPIVVIHPGAGSAVKQWRSEGWAYCATALDRYFRVSHARSFRLVLTGSPGEQMLLQEIDQATSMQTTLITDATIGQLAALLERAQLVLGVDSGPMHLAVAQGTPSVRLYGPIDTRIFGPWGNLDQHRVIISTHRCATCPAIPCGHLDFKPRELIAHACVRLIAEQEVLKEILTVVRREEIAS